ncbi:type VI secretion system protein TssA [Sphingomonas sp. R-74633]|uniref:type VI secretion system protein TssA n=1 Tax=Sphingomonas sp. R-74633 TaxID=2751188 RepID=UPI0015D10FB4|nr:type VI secretion system protein TssA [Sphingomonas sp. R-74633]NYT43202.1 type VI secretion system protein TssA [Sphingomonas sp. R-74633]
MSAELAERVAALLEPIAGDQPTGRDMRYENDYRTILEARREEDARTPRGVWQRDVKQADWAQVERLCDGLLREKSKDLRVAGWLGEAWVQRYGYTGLAPALDLIAGLSERYWDALHPNIDGDADVHIGAIEWLNQRLPLVLRQLPVVIDARAPDTRYSWADHVNAEQLETVRRKDAAAAQRAETGGAVTLEQFEACRNRTATEVFGETAAAMAAAREALDALDAVLDRRCGRDAPGLGRIRSVAGEIGDFAGETLAARGAQAPRLLAAPPEAPSESVIASVVPAAMPPLPASREAAYRQLAAIADLLRAEEPHSPVPYVLDYLIEWGNMPLPQLESELSANGGGISILLSAIGLAQHQE